MKRKLKVSTKIEPVLLPIKYKNVNENTRNITQNKIQEYQTNYQIHGIDYIHETKQKKVSSLLYKKGYLGPQKHQCR